MTEFHRTVRPHEIAAALAELRPPKCTDLELDVVHTPNSDFDAMLRSVLNEVVALWPDGTCFIIELGRKQYLQGRHFSPTFLIEFGPRPTDPDVWLRAREKGWLDPHTVPKTHRDYVSRGDWWENPVQELNWDSTGLPGIVELLAHATTDLLGFESAQARKIKIFCDDTNDADGRQEHAEEPLPARATNSELDFAPHELGLLL